MKCRMVASTRSLPGEISGLQMKLTANEAAFGRSQASRSRPLPEVIRKWAARTRNRVELTHNYAGGDPPLSHQRSSAPNRHGQSDSLP